ncbi:uncharacterized protein BJX67DRAFT_289062 [Aspergillus lucknowensis]|uniref:Uncharacterized protein n=1 Tax=Aspergillus lucknowensis TaxID=176173 RepID=A0ABR4LEC7_9EURO
MTPPWAAIIMKKNFARRTRSERPWNFHPISHPILCGEACVCPSLQLFLPASMPLQRTFPGLVDPLSGRNCRFVSSLLIRERRSQQVRQLSHCCFRRYSWVRQVDGRPVACHTGKAPEYFVNKLIIGVAGIRNRLARRKFGASKIYYLHYCALSAASVLWFGGNLSRPDIGMT